MVEIRRAEDISSVLGSLNGALMRFISAPARW
jgi:hypothetical protein